MAVLFWYPVKSDASVRSCKVDYTGQVHVLQGTRTTRPCITGHPVRMIRYAREETVKTAKRIPAGYYRHRFVNQLSYLCLFYHTLSVA